MARREFSKSVYAEIVKRSMQRNGDIACEPSPDRLRKLLTYNPVTGQFTRLKALNGQCYDRVGSTTSHGYIEIGVDRQRHYAHRIAWAMHFGEWPSTYIDHINGDKADNRISNLRLASNSENMANAPARKTSKTGVRGVHRGRTGWSAQLTVNGKARHLGTFNTIEEAQEAYSSAAKAAFGGFAYAP